MRFLFIIPVMLVLAATLAAQDFAKGLHAYEAGDFAAAVKEWKPLAEGGNSAAQNSVGVLYYNDRGCRKTMPRRFAGIVWGPAGQYRRTRQSGPDV